MRKYQVLASKTVKSGNKSVPNSILINEFTRDILLDRFRFMSTGMLVFVLCRCVSVEDDEGVLIELVSTIFAMFSFSGTDDDIVWFC